MGEKRTRTRVRCLVDELPESVRAEVDEMLADTSNGYLDISAWLTTQGYSISKSSIGRYAQRSGKMAQRLREIRDQAHEYAKLIQENQEMDVAKVASTIYLQGLLRRVVEAGDNEFELVSLKDVGNQISKLLRTHVYEGRYTQQRKDELEKATELVLEQLRAELVSDPEMLAKIREKVQEAKAHGAEAQADA
jgi:hypothetical protein